MTTNFSISLSKEYFNFSAAHFMTFGKAGREPLHGHNYRLKLWLNCHELYQDMVIDFCQIKPLVRELLQKLDHKMLIPLKNTDLIIDRGEAQTSLKTLDNSVFNIPTKDISFLPITNTSVERIGEYLAAEIKELIKTKLNIEIVELKIEVEETLGQSAIFHLKN